MKYIPDKTLFKAVMFALKMCPVLDYVDESRVKKAAEYYQVDYNDVFNIVYQELWDRFKKEHESETEWITLVYDHQMHGFIKPHTSDIIIGSMLFVCPHCFKVRSCSLNADCTCSLNFLTPCECGFIDHYQRNVIRKTEFEWMKQRGIL